MTRAGPAVVGHQLAHPVGTVEGGHDGVADAAPRGFVPLPFRAASPVIHRTVLTKLVTAPNADHQIWDAVIGGRSPSPFPGTMGAHSTAWVAHLDAIRRHVVNLSVIDGAFYLVNLANDAADEQKSPLLALKDTLPAEQKKIMTTARTVMMAQAKRLEDFATAGTTDAATMISALRGLIEDYLTFVNYQPTATVKGGDPSGHGEGVARGALNQFEYMCALTKRSAELARVGDDRRNLPAQDERNLDLLRSAKEQIKKSTFGKLLVAASANNFDPAKHATLRTEMVQNLWAMFAAETPGVYASQTAAPPLKVWTAALKNFLHTIRLGYPYGYEFTAMHTPAAQWEGLQYALGEASVVLSDELQRQLHETIHGRAGHGQAAVPAMDNVEPAVRGLDQYAEVAQSDLFGGGAGFTVTVLMSGPLVASVEMTGRTLTPFSVSMGAHTTAWTAVEDALRARVVHKPLAVAITALRQVATRSLTDERLDLTHLVSEKQQHHLAQAYSALDALLKDTTTLLTDQTKISFLESLIRVYLTYTNLLPLSTIESGGVPGGRSEGRARTFLLAFEANGVDEIPNGVDEVGYVTERIRALFDPGGLEMFPPDLGEHREALTIGPHPLMAKFNATDPAPSEDEITAMAVTEFFNTVSVAYPKAVKFIGWKLDAADPQLPIQPMDQGSQIARTQQTGGGHKRVLDNPDPNPKTKMVKQTKPAKKVVPFRGRNRGRPKK